MYRTGLLAALRSKAKGSQIIGVMITASHNPAEVPNPPSPHLADSNAILTWVVG
jgi:hypothetical protein